MLQPELQLAITLARHAGKRILEHYITEFETVQKLAVDNHYEPVTLADKDASRIIVEGIEAQFPSDAVLSEEETDDLGRRLAARRVWIIDPMDGTAGFVKRDGDFCVQIGLTNAGVPVLGVVFLPVQETLMYAVKGGGCFMAVGEGETTRVTVSEQTMLSEMTLAASRNHRSPKMGRIIEHFGFPKIVSRGSVGLKVALIANRTCDIYIHPSPRTKLWDSCAPQIILEEAGGRFTDLFGGEIVYDSPQLSNLNGLLATNGVVHEAAVEKLRPILAEFGRVRAAVQ
jgi:3'(2'), 5'-bisphosphate nucleotidase